MSYTAILHTHTLFVSLYIIIFLVKVYLLLSNKYEKLGVFRKKTKILEMVLPTLFLVTGIYLAYRSPYAGETWFILKMVLILLTIVFGILAFNRKNKPLAILTLVIFAYIFGMSFKKTLSLRNRVAVIASHAGTDDYDSHSPSYNAVAHGKFLFTKYNCVSCHGETGDKKSAGAADLTKTTLSETEIENVIRNGRKNMAAYGGYLTEDQLNALAAFIKSLKK